MDVTTLIDSLDLDESELCSIQLDEAARAIKLQLRTVHKPSLWTYLKALLVQGERPTCPTESYTIVFKQVSQITRASFLGPTLDFSGIEDLADETSKEPARTPVFPLDIDGAEDSEPGLGKRHFQLIVESELLEFFYQSATVTCTTG